MTKVPALASREIRAYFVQPIAYVAIFVFLAILTAGFAVVLFNYIKQMRAVMGGEVPSVTDKVVRVFFSNRLLYALWAIVPLVTMRLLADEKRAGTAELLLTSPIPTLELVLGKWLGAMGIVLALFVFTAHFPLYLLTHATPDVNVIATIYLGVILVSGLFVSVGLLASALTENQIVAALLCLIFLMALFGFGFLSTALPGKAAEILRTFSVMDSYNEFVKGVIDTRAIFFFVSSTGFFIFLTQRILDSQRWR